MADPSPGKSAELGQIVTLTIAVLVFAYGLIRWPLLAFMQWGHRKLGLVAWEAELAANRRLREEVDALAAESARNTQRLDGVEGGMSELSEQVKHLPAIRSIAERSCDSSERTEKTIETIAAQILTITSQVGEIKGAINRSVGPMRGD